MAEAQTYGGFWARLIALVLDNAIVFLMLLAAALLAGMAVVTVGLDGLAGLALNLVVMFLPFLYWPVMESSGWQATVGKRVMGLTVADAEGNRLSFVHALLRALAKFISAIPLGIGFLIAAFTARKQALHDLIVKTVVIRSGPSHLWKVILALVLGFVLMVASAAGLFYYVLLPMFTKGFGFGDPVKVQAKSAPQAKAVPAAKAPAAPAAPASPAAPAPAAKPAAAAPSAPAPAMPALNVAPDPEFDAVAGKPIALDKPNSARAGPAIAELSTVFPNNVVWVKFYLPMPSHGDPSLIPGPIVRVMRVLDAAGVDFSDPANTFEKDEFFQRVTLGAAKDPVPHLAGTRSVHMKPGLNEQTLRKVEGTVTYTLPVDPKAAAFGARETGKETPIHDSVVSLKSVAGNTAKLHFRGASENLLAVRGFGADGKPLATESRQTLPRFRDVDDDFDVTFKGAPAKVEMVVAAKVIDRAFAFSVARGATAGPPESAAQGQTMPPRPRAVQAAPKPAAAVAAAAAKPEPKAEAAAKPAAEPKPVPKAEPKPAAVAAAPAPAPKPRPAPAAATAAAAAPSAPAAPAERPGRPGPKFNDVMTAVIHRDTAAVNELLDMGRWVDKRDAGGLTPLMVAVRLRDAATAQLLVRRGADVNASGPGGASPLRDAVANGDAAMAEMLRRSGAR